MPHRKDLTTQLGARRVAAAGSPRTANTAPASYGRPSFQSSGLSTSYFLAPLRDASLNGLYRGVCSAGASPLLALRALRLRAATLSFAGDWPSFQSCIS